jgi:flagellar hook-length control protein FliK
MNWLSGISDRFFQTELPSDSAKAADVMALAASRGEGVALGLREALSRLRLQPVGDVGRANMAMAGFNSDRFLSSGASGRNALAEQMLAANLDSSAALLKGGGQSDTGSWGRQGAESAFQIASLTESGRLTGSEVKPAFATLANNASQQADVVRQMGQHAKMMLTGKVQFAELKLTPANLGTVEILMKQENDQTTLVFFSKNPAVREAIENNLLRLQKNFEEDGLMLGQASVSDQSLAEHKEQMDAETEHQRSSTNIGLTEELVTVEQPLVIEQDGSLNLWV